MSWTISYDGTDIVFPNPPEKITRKLGAKIKEIPVPGENMLLIFGNKAKQMTWSGVIEDNGKSIETLITDYVLVLDGFMHHVVTLSNTFFNGDWALSDSQISVEKGVVSLLKYKMEFTKATDIIEVS